MPAKTFHLLRAFAAFVVLALATDAYGQNAIINAVEPTPTDLSAASSATSRQDLSGKPCALVKVSVMAEDVTFQGNVVKDVPRIGSEYWVYMTEGTKLLRFSSSKFKPVTINFPDYGIPELKGTQTYRIDVSIPSSTPVGAAVLLTVTPADARVYIDDKIQEVTDGVATAYLRQGTHTYRIEAEGYKPSEGKIKMENKAIKMAVKLFSIDKLKVKPYRGINGKIGFKDQNDKIVVKPDYDKVIPASNVFWVTKKGKYGMVNEQGNVVASPKFDSVTASTTDGIFIVSQNGKYGVINPNGWLTVPCMLDKISTTSSSMLVGIMDGRFGLIDSSGELIIPCENEEITDFFDGMAGIKKDGKCGFINTDGELVIPFQYDGITHFSGGIARVVKDGTVLYIDKQGRTVNL